MRTTLDLPDPLLRELKARAALSGQSLKALLTELIQRAMRMPAVPESGLQTPPTLPTLPRLQTQASQPPLPALDPADLADLELQDDLDKLRRIGFVQ
jgi:hypothetical protein